MQKNRLAGILSLFGLGKPESMRFLRFIDGSGNFQMLYPEGWRYDPNIAIIDGKYTISFESRDGQKTFTIAVDSMLPSGFSFPKYAKKELEGPSAGIIASCKKGKFKSMPCYRREYAYVSGGRKYFGGGVMLCTGRIVFSISWNAPEKEKEKMLAVFEHMLDSFRSRGASSR